MIDKKKRNKPVYDSIINAVKRPLHRVHQKIEIQPCHVHYRLEFLPNSNDLVITHVSPFQEQILYPRRYLLRITYRLRGIGKK